MCFGTDAVEPHNVQRPSPSEQLKDNLLSNHLTKQTIYSRNHATENGLGKIVCDYFKDCNLRVITAATAQTALTATNSERQHIVVDEQVHPNPGTLHESLMSPVDIHSLRYSTGHR